MRVIHITSSIDKSTGGPARSVPKTCIELAKLGVEVDLITQPSLDPVYIPNIKNLRLTNMSLKALYNFGKSLKTNAIDFIHVQHIWTPYVNVMAYWAKRKNIPYVITPRGMLEPWIMAQNPWKKKLAMWFYQRKTIQNATLLHATSEMEKQNIQKLGFTNPIEVIPNGIDLEEVTSKKTAYGSKKMGFLSRIHPKKGIELLLEAWSSTNTKDWCLEIAGNGEESYIQTLKQSAAGLKNVRFEGPQYGEAKWDFLRSADVMVLPTHSENFGIVVAEALAVGVPVITTKGTPWQDLETHHCGWWINLSVEQLQKTLTMVMNTPISTLNDMGKNGQLLLKKKYDIKAVADQMHKLYKQFETPI